MKPLLILADDLTGAADSAARSRHAGFPATIFLQPPRLPLPDGVIAFTSDSRHLSAQEAAARTRAAVASLADLDVRWYKKIDSTLRGNLGSEIDALLDLKIAPCAVICPAFPAQGRALIDGVLVAPGVTAQIHLPALLRSQSRRRVATLSLDDLRGEGAAQMLREKIDHGGQLIVADAAQDTDLHHILSAVHAATPDALLCGSAGLVGALTAQEARSAPRSAPIHRAKQNENKGALLVIGSGSAMARRQIETLRSRQSVTAWTVSAGAVFEGAGDTMLLHLPPPAQDALLDGPQARALAELLADGAEQILAQRRPSLLILSGGDTAMQVLARLGIDRLTVLAELLPGMPLCVGQDVQGRWFDIVMKPGSFGQDDTLITLLDLVENFHLNQESEECSA